VVRLKNLSFHIPVQTDIDGKPQAHGVGVDFMQVWDLVPSGKTTNSHKNVLVVVRDDQFGNLGTK